jgi:hypothetical protein
VSYRHVDAVLRGAIARYRGAPQPMDPSTKLVLLVLAEHANIKTGLTWPSVDTIARFACLHKRNVSAHLAKLLADDWIAIARGGKGGRPKKGSGFSTVYRINLAKLHATKNHDAGVTVSERENNDADSMVSLREIMLPTAGNHGAGVQPWRRCHENHGAGAMQTRS